MDPLSTGATIVGALGGLFGKKKKNPFAPYQTQGYAGLSSNASEFGSLADSARAGLGEFDSGYQNAVRGLSSILQRNPYSDQYRSARFNEMDAGNTSAYLRAKSNLTADLARRGLTGDSSSLSGGLAAIEGIRAGQIGQIDNDLYQQEIDDERNRATALVGLQGSARGNYLSQYGGALDSESGLLAQLAGLATNEGRYTDARNDYADQGSTDLLTAIGQILARGSGGGGGNPTSKGSIAGSGGKVFYRK